MIIISLLGGLGNQMFQYALGRALSIKLQTDLVLDLSSFEGTPLRSYQLQYFPIHARIFKGEDITRIIPDRLGIKYITKRLLLKILKQESIVIIKEKSLAFDPNILKTKKNSMMQGYWQTEKYFSTISGVIKSDFSFSTIISPKNDETLRSITKKEAVSLHIRRGDYLTNPIANSYHGVCSLDYYHNAMKIIEKSVKEPEYFIFTDDPEWARINIITNKPKVIIDWNVNSPQEDLRLMSSCKHHIIANSSFSWWGAWLGNNENKIVIAPEPWLDTKKNYMQDIYGNNWIRIAKNN